MKQAVGAALLSGALVASPAVAAEISDNVVRIGVLGDMSGTYSHVSGAVSVESAKLAVERFGGRVAGAKIEILTADMQNKADLAANIAREWFDKSGVDVIIDVPNSAAALAVSEVGRQRNKLVIVTTAGTSELTAKSCAPTTLHWTYNTTALATVAVKPVVKSGGTKWFFLTADYAFGHALQKEAGDAVIASGGKVVGSVRAPINTVDFSSYILQAQGSGANVLGLANAGADSANSIKGAQEFGLIKDGIGLASFLITLPDVHSLGAKNTEGLYVASPFYWDLNDNTRQYSMEVVRRTGGKYPDSFAAGVYSGVTRYLEVVARAGTDDALQVVSQMKAEPFDDPLFGRSTIRSDGRVVHDFYLFKVKREQDVKTGWDLYSVVSKVSGEEAFGPVVKGLCNLSGAAR